MGLSKLKIDEWMALWAQTSNGPRSAPPGHIPLTIGVHAYTHILYNYRRVPILLPFSISGFQNFGDFRLFSNNFATTREVGTPMRCARCCLKLSASFDIWWSCTYDEQIGCKSRSKMNFWSLAIEISRFWGAQIENWIDSIPKITMLFPNPLSHLREILCPRS